MEKERSIKSALSSEADLSKETLERRVLDNCRLVSYAVNHIEEYIPYQMTWEDAAQYGMIGLTVAGKTYRESMGNFSTWAYIQIRGHVFDGMMEYMPLKRTLGREFAAWRRTRDKLQRKNPLIDEAELAQKICSAMHISSEKEQELHAIEDFSTLTSEEVERDPEYVHLRDAEQEKEWEMIMVREDIACAVKKLPKAQKEIVMRHFFQGQPHRVIIEEMGLSRRSFRREYDRALHKLRQELREYGE